MILHCCVLLLFSSCARTMDDNSFSDVVKKLADDRYSFWPSIHNAATIMRIRKRELSQNQEGLSEGGGVEAEKQAQPDVKPQQDGKIPSSAQSSASSNNDKNITMSNELPKVDTSSNANGTITSLPVSANDKLNVTSAKTSPAQLDLNSPGVLKRALIVFGGFALMAVAYFIFYRRKNSKNDASNSHSINDANQFRYGVLQSDDKSNLELSRMPLTMESDEDDDEDLEIFDLEQKRKSLSYVNLQANDEDIVLNSAGSKDDRDNLLLDIEDRSSDTLINWSNNGNKSIL